MKKANPYDPTYIMKRDNCSFAEAEEYIKSLKEKSAWNKGKKIKKANPYDPTYIMKRDNCSFAEAEEYIKQYKQHKATTLSNFIKRYGKEIGTEKYNSWKNKSLAKGWEISKKNGKSQSKFSPEYYIRHGYNRHDAYKMAIQWQHENSPLHIEYYIKRGKDIEYARKMIRKIHDKKIGRDCYREYLENTTDYTKQEIDKIIKESRGNFSKEKLDIQQFNERIYKTRKTFERKGIWIPLSDLSDYELYRREVWKYTDKNDLSSLENYEKRGRAGVPGAYHLDHKFSISRGFIEGISPDIIGSIQNLEFITWEDNVRKQGKCSILKEDLFKNENKKN